MFCRPGFYRVHAFRAATILTNEVVVKQLPWSIRWRLFKARWQVRLLVFWWTITRQNVLVKLFERINVDLAKIENSLHFKQVDK